MDKKNRVRDGANGCRGCGLPNYEGICPRCRGDEQGAREELGEWATGRSERSFYTQTEEEK